MEELGLSFSGEDHNMIMNKMRTTKGKLPLFCSSNSSTSSPLFSSSSHQHNIRSIAALSQMPIYENQQRRQVGSNYNWLGNNSDCEPGPEGDTCCSFRFNSIGAASNLDLIDIKEDSRRESAAVVHVMEKEHMFDKVVTPSDVGKLNRLVIPKQHAEKYFPLDSLTNDKRVLLNFEDRNGKAWRFRYSYWNSSQSYVMTKGWSRFVKDTKLDAGDIVSFQRGVGDLGMDHLYIDWRRRPPDAPDPTVATSSQYYHHSYQQTFSSIPWSPLLMRPQPTSQLLPRDHLHLSNPPPNINAYYSGGGPYGYGLGQSNYSNLVKISPCSTSLGSTFYNMRSAAAAPAPNPQQQTLMGMFQRQQEAGGVVESMEYKSVPVVQGKVAAKRLRLFGVNMVCPVTESNECDVLPSNTIPPHATPLQQLTRQHSSYHTQHELRLRGATPLQPIPYSDLFNKKKPSASQDLDI